MSDYGKISAATDVALDNAKKGMIGGKITAADQQELNRMSFELKVKVGELSTQHEKIDNFLDFSEATTNSQGM